MCKDKTNERLRLKLADLSREQNVSFDSQEQNVAFDRR